MSQVTGGAELIQMVQVTLYHDQVHELFKVQTYPLWKALPTVYAVSLLSM